MKTVAIIQARASSSRLPGKVLMEIAGRPMLGLVVHRLAGAKRLDQIVVATSTDGSDDAVARFCKDNGMVCIRGALDDVLDRYMTAVRQVGAGCVVRITADCPLVDPTVVDEAIAEFDAGDFDYLGNIDPPTYPDGLDVEVMTPDALECAWRQARMRSEREHVTPYIRNRQEQFRIGQLRNDRDLSHLRWTVDEPADLEFVRRVFARLADERAGMHEVLRLLEHERDLQPMNAGIGRDEGLARSLREDACIR